MAAKQAKPKRFRPCGPPFHEVLYGQSGRSLRVKLDEPEDGQECPLTLAPVAEDRLECLSEQARWYPAFPDVKRATLSCGHSFGALNILYHFARRNMRCPCCRAGFDSRLTISCIPPNFRQTLSSKVQDELRADRSEQIEVDEALARSAVVVEVEMTFIRVQDVTNRSAMSLRAKFEGDPGTPAYTIEVPMEHSGIGGQASLFLEHGTFSSHIESQLRDPSVRKVTLSVHFATRDPELNGLVAQTAAVDIDRSRRSEVMRVPAFNDLSVFELDLRWSFDGLRLAGLRWRRLA